MLHKVTLKNLSFRRITSSGKFIPEIDGLRFIAITSIVFYHWYGFVSEKDINQYKDHVDYSFWLHFLSHAHLGVPLFFVISGFILGIPFAKYYLANDKPVALKAYFFRRLTRLEPPYVLVMTALLFGAVFVAKTMSFGEGIKSYLASITYSHNLFFPGVNPRLNAVAWSLEVEVQFYILAPIMACVFLIKSSSVRRVVLWCATLLFIIINNLYFYDLHVLTLINFFQYFLIGFILSDLYVSNSRLLPETKADYLIGLFFFMVIWLFDATDFQSDIQKIGWEIVQLSGIFFLYYYILFHKIFRFLSLRVITNIGGMCYSIYLLHYPIISMFGNSLLARKFSAYSFVNVSIYSCIIISLVLFVSAVFFLLIERPCMDKNWYKKIFSGGNKDVQAESRKQSETVERSTVR
jgi:peptidoglycan/LPS O-acetylase OafA/YrhL